MNRKIELSVDRGFYEYLKNEAKLLELTVAGWIYHRILFHYLKGYPIPEEGIKAGKCIIRVTLPEELIEKLNEDKQRLGTTRSEVIRRILKGQVSKALDETKGF